MLSKLKPTLVPTDELAFNRILILNINAIRLDLYKGLFSRDTEYNVLSFANDWKYLKLEKRVAIQIEDFLNHRSVTAMLNSPEQLLLQNIEYHNEINKQNNRYNTAKHQEYLFIDDPKITEGYTTNDDYGYDGDDTP